MKKKTLPVVALSCLFGTSLALMAPDAGKAATSDLKAYKANVSVKKDNTALWKDSKLKSNKKVKKDTVYRVDGYRMINGKKYYRVYQNDYKGYIYYGNVSKMEYHSYGKKVYISKGGSALWNDLYYGKKKGTTKDKQVYLAKGYYYLQGKRYYSVYRKDGDGKEKWWGYTYGSNAKPVESDSVYNKYFDFKNISDKTGYFNKTAKLKFYKGPTSNYGTTERSVKYKDKVVYTDESFNEIGNRVKVYIGSKPSSKTFLGWVDRRDIYNSSTTAKMANPDKNGYGVWSSPNGGTKLSTMASFQKSHLEVNQEYINTKGKTQYHVVANGANAGWVDSNFVLRDQISVPSSISLVRSYDGNQTKWNPINAVNYATTKYGSTLNPTKDVKASVSSIDTSKPGTYKVTYKTSTASKTVNVTVRSQNEQVVKYTANPQAPASNYPKVPYLNQSTNLNYTLTDYRGTGGYGTAPGGDNGYAKTNTANKWTTAKGTPNLTFNTQLFTPYRLSYSSNTSAMANAETSQPQGLAVIGNNIYVLYKKLDESSTSNAMKDRGYIVRYDKTKMGSLKDLRSLSDLAKNDFKKYASICSGITVGPEIVIGHGQTLTTDGKNLYVNVTNENEDRSNFNNVNAFNKIDLNTLGISKYQTSRIVAKSAGSYVGNKTFFNMAMADENTFYGLCKSNDYANTQPDTVNAGNFEVWKSVRQSDGSFKSSQVLTLRMPIGNKTPIQGMTYVKENNALYITTDGGFVGITLPTSTEGTGGSKLVANVKLNSQKREFEGISYANGKLYIGTNKGSEVMAANYAIK